MDITTMGSLAQTLGGRMSNLSVPVVPHKFRQLVGHILHTTMQRMSVSQTGHLYVTKTEEASA